jgi:hypothetical protein
MRTEGDKPNVGEEILDHLSPGQAPAKWELRAKSFRRLSDGSLRYNQSGNGGGCLGMILLTTFLAFATYGVPWPYRWVPLVGFVASVLGLVWFLGAKSFVVVSKERVLAARTWFRWRLMARSFPVASGQLEVVKVDEEGDGVGTVSIYGLQIRDHPDQRLPIRGSRGKAEALRVIFERELGPA